MAQRSARCTPALALEFEIVIQRRCIAKSFSLGPARRRELFSDSRVRRHRSSHCESRALPVLQRPELLPLSAVHRRGGTRRRQGREMYTLYSMQRSGNCYKVRLALAKLRIPYRLVEIDILRGESRTPEFLEKNPSGRVPLLEVAAGRYLPESNAILWYIAGGTPLAPEDRIDRAETLQW